MPISKSFDKKLFSAAKKARDFSYSPYSNFAVGAALNIRGSSKIYTGCNVENGSYGATICAERTAILKLASESKKKFMIENICVITKQNPVAPPCGMCMQVISEFADDNTRILLSDLKGIQKEYLFKDIMPIRFKL